jgi:hypothetical protein
VPAPGNWYIVRVPADNFASNVVRFSAKAFVEDMRDPTFTWTLLAAWGPVSITATGDSQKFQFQIPASVQPGDVGYGDLWVKAVDADGLVVSMELPLKIRVDDCCNTDMFNELFNQFCAAKVGLQRERCPLPVIDPD